MKFDLPTGWTLKTLSECCDENISYGIVQPGAHDDNGVPVVRVNNFKANSLDLNDVLKVSTAVSDKYKRTVLKGGEVLLTLVGSTGQSTVVPSSMIGWNVPRAIAVIRVSKEIGADWVNLCLQSPFSKYFLDARANTTVQKTLNLKDVKEIPIPVPPVEYKTKALRVLGSLQEKLLLNTQTNQTLEEMAQAIFKSWFVDFDPVKAKMRGEQPEGMDAVTASFFPAKLVESELGLVPEGWEVKAFSDWVKITKGKNITQKTIVEGDVPVIAGGLKPAYFHNTHNVEGPVITISASGANAGFINLYYENIWASDSSYISKAATPLFFLQYVALKFNQKKIYDMQTGAAQPHIYPRDFERLLVVVPSDELSQKLEGIFTSFFETVSNHKKQSIELSKLRDALLPKLLSGEIEL